MKSDRIKILKSHAADAVLFILGAGLLFTLAKFPTDWDACQFVLGMNRFSPPDHQPHPPGYFFFILFAKMVKFVAGGKISDYQSLLAASVFAGAMIIPAIRHLTLRLFPGRNDIAIGVSLLALGAPTRLYFGVQALSYTWEGLLSILLVLYALDLAAQAKEGGGGRNNVKEWLGWLALWAVAGGFRPNLLLYFFPLAIYLAIRQRWRANIIGAVVVAVVTALWLVPSALYSGGFVRYFQSVQGHSEFFTMSGLGAERIIDNVVALYNTASAVAGLHTLAWLMVIIFAGAIAIIGRKKLIGFDKHRRNVLLFALLPMLMFHIFLMYSLRYSLLYLPILLPVLVKSGSMIFEGNKIIREGKISGWVLPAVICGWAYFAFITGSGIHSLGHIRSLERETEHVAGIVKGLGVPYDNDVLIIAGRKFRQWGMIFNDGFVLHPMHALYPSDMNPRLAIMEDGDTVAGNFFLPGAEPKGEFLWWRKIDEQISAFVVLDEDAYRVLKDKTMEWNSERITSRENLYWREFDYQFTIYDTEQGIEFVPFGEGLGTPTSVGIFLFQDVG